jgi:hypothetical protein
MEVERNEGKANKERAQERLVRREEGGGESKSLTQESEQPWRTGA